MYIIARNIARALSAFSIFNLSIDIYSINVSDIFNIFIIFWTTYFSETVKTIFTFFGVNISHFISNTIILYVALASCSVRRFVNLKDNYLISSEKRLEYIFSRLKHYSEISIKIFAAIFMAAFWPAMLAMSVYVKSSISNDDPKYKEEYKLWLDEYQRRFLLEAIYVSISILALFSVNYAFI